MIGSKGRSHASTRVVPSAGWLWLAGAAALGFAALGAASRAGIEFVAPTHLQTVIGPSEVRLRVETPEGVEVERIEVSVDGRPLVTLTAPPWSTKWDAGLGDEGHRLEAVAHLSDGTEVRSKIRTSPLRVTEFEEVALVNLYAVARDARGDYVTDLTRNEFRITENGRPQEIERFTPERKPLRVAIVLDASLTMEGRKLALAREAALRFLDVLEPNEQGMVVAFSDEVRVAQDLTGDRAALEAAIESVQARGGTALYDAIWRTSERLRAFDGRRVLVLLSDGRDEAGSGLEPGSLHTLTESLNRALHDEVIIFAIGIGKHLDEQVDFYRRRTLKAILEEMAKQTGGRALFPGGPGGLKKAFQEIAEDLRHMYAIAYVSDDKRLDGSWREIHLSTTRPGVTVYTRRGYYAPDREVSTGD